MGIKPGDSGVVIGYRWVPLKLDFLGAWKSVRLKHYLAYPIIIISLIIEKNLAAKIWAKWEYGLTTVWLKWDPPVLSGWWVYLHLVCRVVCGLLPHLSRVHWQGVIINPFSPGTRVWGLCLFGWGCCWLWRRLGLHPHWFTRDTGIGHFPGGADAITSLVYSGFLCWVSTLSDNSKPQLAPSIHTRNLWCQVRAILAPVATKMSASKWIRYFLATLLPLGSRPLLHQITSLWILPTGKLISLFQISDWSWCHGTCYSWHRAAYFSSPGYPASYSFLSARGWGRCYTCVCVWSAWITSLDSWYFGQGCSKQVGNSACISHICLILFPGSVMRFGLHISLFSIVFRRWILLSLWLY